MVIDKTKIIKDISSLAEGKTFGELEFIEQELTTLQQEVNDITNYFESKYVLLKLGGEEEERKRGDTRFKLSLPEITENKEDFTYKGASSNDEEDLTSKDTIPNYRKDLYKNIDLDFTLKGPSSNENKGLIDLGVNFTPISNQGDNFYKGPEVKKK